MIFTPFNWNIIIPTIFLLDHEAHCVLIFDVRHAVRCFLIRSFALNDEKPRISWLHFSFVYRFNFFLGFCFCKNGDKFSSWTDETSGSSISLVECFKCIVSLCIVLRFSWVLNRYNHLFDLLIVIFLQDLF